MLGRTANGLYWMQRYIERAENTARMVDVGQRMALTRSQIGDDEWGSILTSAGVMDGYSDKHGDVEPAKVIDYMLRDRDNGSSVASVMDAARSNARMVRTALTREVFESVNEAYMVLKELLSSPLTAVELPSAINTIKQESALIRGALLGTMLRNDSFNFCRIGTFVERADNTARILDVKYYVLLPSDNPVGSSLDNVQWESILRSVSAHKSYRWSYEGEYTARNISHFLILNGRVPRSLLYCYRMILRQLGDLKDDYGQTRDCHESARQSVGRLEYRTVEEIFNEGLHEYLTRFIENNNELGQQISETYRFV